MNRIFRYVDGTFVEYDYPWLGERLEVPCYQSPLSIAREKGHDGIVKLLEDAGAADFYAFQFVDEVD